jgi:hypothetical protein
VNAEGIRLSPLFAKDNSLWFGVLEGRADPDPPFRLYPSNVNQASGGRNPFAGFERRWYR